VDEEIKPGYYKDENGVWRKDRRKTPDRRKKQTHNFGHHDRRTFYRRKADREILAREARAEIDDALEALEDNRIGGY
jgi:hypothetical protein